jgi:hypothetical protein
MKYVLIALCSALSFQLFAQEDPAVFLYKQKQDEENRKKPKVDTLYREYFPLNEKREIQYTGVITVPNTDAQTLYSRAKLFIAETYKNAKEVSQLTDDVSKTLIAKPVVSTMTTGFWTGGLSVYVKYNFKLECKDGKFRYTIESLVWQYIDKRAVLVSNLFEVSRPAIANKKMWIQVMEQTDTELKHIIKLLSEKMLVNSNDF